MQDNNLLAGWFCGTSRYVASATMSCPLSDIFVSNMKHLPEVIEEILKSYYEVGNTKVARSRIIARIEGDLEAVRRAVDWRGKGSAHKAIATVE